MSSSIKQTREQELLKELDEAEIELKKVQEEIVTMQTAELLYKRKIFSCKERIDEIVKQKKSS